MKAIASQRGTRKRFVLPGAAEYNAIPEDVVQGSAHERIASIVPLIVAKINYFLRTLRVREASHCERTDLLQEIWVTLLEKDRYFDPNRGVRYSTWAIGIAIQKLGMMRNRCRVISTPANTPNKLRAKDSTAAAAIRRVHSGIGTLSPKCPAKSAVKGDDYGLNAMIAKEERYRACRKVKSILGAMELKSAVKLGNAYGVCGEATPIRKKSLRKMEREFRVAAELHLDTD